ncbi:MAG: cysteine dioxygenase family protein [Pelatocladus maniniholoensis HA4357-MV3]|jgi:predicted metal-dependent enzyme (double-stranded beta helix superfamily)|uniref:Cysteine dioxygenase family protein n=1 Tax=Pelatocladus maniniholoensis HA4357-MV3 TaxID=1117104 RepID=A0A9E3LRZ0_9NOST|nr:cysteine dioxygenase family protein [Pelatocladus maniniholoensis HA4357-MV3]BAZ69927.1 hypothetical protein NIES4106_47080 [Fischerella sp. NIES-4106]
MIYTTPLEASTADQWFIDSPELLQFVAIAREISLHKTEQADTLCTLEPYFSQLLKTEGWLPSNFAQPNLDSNIGGGIGQWLLYRSQDSSLTIFSLVIPPGASTPIYDHQSWGLVGLYKGKQEKTVYQRVDQGNIPGHAQLEVLAVRQLKAGDIYQFLPPDNDIHTVKTTTQFAPSVSIHVLSNDMGCSWRHQYNPETETVRSFRSGYANIFCKS